MRACHYIYKSRSLGTWQYLAILPFSDVYIGTLWKLYYFLVTGEEDIEQQQQQNQDFKGKIMDGSNFLIHFNDTIVDVQADDMYYLLQTFSSMAMAQSNLEFIERITLDLFQVIKIKID